MDQIELATLRRILTEIKEAATNFGDTPAELINRLCDANYLAERGVKLIDKAEAQSRRAEVPEPVLSARAEWANALIAAE